mmetsp:Transcript_26173/g.49442  ORF Transcript_26173/g.49442 Transcript_26173/m.49442 type:complete len:395 (+) Transcript_26173:4042-5226(+)
MIKRSNVHDALFQGLQLRVTAHERLVQHATRNIRTAYPGVLPLENEITLSNGLVRRDVLVLALYPDVVHVGEGDARALLEGLQVAQAGVGGALHEARAEHHHVPRQRELAPLLGPHHPAQRAARGHADAGGDARDARQGLQHVHRAQHRALRVVGEGVGGHAERPDEGAPFVLHQELPHHALLLVQRLLDAGHHLLHPVHRAGVVVKVQPVDAHEDDAQGADLARLVHRRVEGGHVHAAPHDARPQNLGHKRAQVLHRAAGAALGGRRRGAGQQPIAFQRLAHVGQNDVAGGGHAPVAVVLDQAPRLRGDGHLPGVGSLLFLTYLHLDHSISSRKKLPPREVVGRVLHSPDVHPHHFLAGCHSQLGSQHDALRGGHRPHGRLYAPRARRTREHL